jgi:hypothetical protein
LLEGSLYFSGALKWIAKTASDSNLAGFFIKIESQWWHIDQLASVQFMNCRYFTSAGQV